MRRVALAATCAMLAVSTLAAPAAHAATGVFGMTGTIELGGPSEPRCCPYTGLPPSGAGALDGGSYRISATASHLAQGMAAVDLCGDLRRTPSDTLTTVLGAACHVLGGPDYYTENGGGTMDWADGTQWVITDLRWAPTAGGAVVAYGRYEVVGASPPETGTVLVAFTGQVVFQPCLLLPWRTTDTLAGLGTTVADGP